MLHRLILKVTKFQLPPPKRLGTMVENNLGGHDASPPPYVNRVKWIQHFSYKNLSSFRGQNVHTKASFVISMSVLIPWSMNG